MSVLGAMLDGMLAAVSQRPFWTEAKILELVRDKIEQTIEALYGPTDRSKSAIAPKDLRAMRIFATDQQQTWLVADSSSVFCVLDDRRRERPKMQWRSKLEDALPVQVDDSRSIGVIHFGDREKGWVYSKELFPGEPAAVAVNQFLAKT